MSVERFQLGFLGAGRMAQALAGHFVRSGKIDPATICFYDPQSSATAAFAELAEGSAAVGHAREVIQNSKRVLLAVKPQVLANDAELREELERLPRETVLVSVVAGCALDELQRMTRGGQVVRLMPNTPCLVGAGAIAMSWENAVEREIEFLRDLVGSAGYLCEVPESWMDIVTGLSGSGPAYVFTFVEALIEGAVRSGMARDTAHQLAVQTVLGSARMLAESDLHPAQLRDQVTSPGGTTAAGLAALESNAFRHAVSSAVVAAANRARELGNNE